MFQCNKMENKIIEGDCITEMKKLPENSVDAVVTDPPYGLEFMGKEWDKFKQGNELNKKNQLQQFCYSWAKECLRVLKPGGFLLSFGGTRTYHRMVCGIEDAGFEIRDMIEWFYGSGFPKSLNIGKQVDKIQGKEREIIGKENYSMPKADNTIGANSYGISGGSLKNGVTAKRIISNITKGNSEWEGWGTALKPAHEPICVARKPLSEKNVALNVLKWGTGGINIDESRINYKSEQDKSQATPQGKCTSNIAKGNRPDVNTEGRLDFERPKQIGRFPANLILDEEAGKMLDEQSGVSKSNPKPRNRKVKGMWHNLQSNNPEEYNDKGGASRFFYCAKASKSERNIGLADVNSHPTVKPIKLMEYLIKLVSKEGAVILEPFLGSGTTALACVKLNRKFIGIEKEPEYIEIAKARIKHFQEQIK